MLKGVYTFNHMSNFLNDMHLVSHKQELMGYNEASSRDMPRADQSVSQFLRELVPSLM